MLPKNPPSKPRRAGAGKARKEGELGRAERGTPFRSGRVAIVGRPNVGKSTLMNAVLGERIAITSKHPQTTRDRIAGVVTDAETQIVFLDTPGVHQAKTKLGARMNGLARDATRDADVIIFLTDVAPSSGGDLREGVRAADVAILRALPTGKPVILAVNKVDRVKDKGLLLPVLETHAKAHPFTAIVPMSAIRANGTLGLLKEVRALLPEGPKLFEEDELSDKPTRFFVTEFVREQILRKTYEEVPHGVAVTCEMFDEGPRVPRIELAVHVDKESHKRIIIGKKGQMLKEIGSDARARVEELLGKQVHLQIWVRVTPGWYDAEAGLREMGYGDSQ